MTRLLADLLPAPPDPDAIFDAFTEWATGTGLEPYPAQTEALIELVSGSNVILTTPTGSGKSLVATGMHFAGLAQGRRTFYSAPIKALVSEKFFALCDIFGAERVGMLTGDAAVNPTAPIVCCTAEVLANIALREGAAADIGGVVMDEFHFYAEPDRGWAWQVPLLELPQAQFLLMSATLGDVTRFQEDLTARTGRATAVVTSATRPIPLLYSWALTPVHETIEDLLMARQAPIYVVHFTQKEALERAQSLLSVTLCTREQKDEIAAAIGDFRFARGFGATLSKLVRHGVGVHHAGMLPKYRRLVEQLTQAGLLKVVCGTDTLGVGINVPIRTVLLTGLAKYDGHRTRILKAREFHQIAGRAGRAGFDTTGYCVVQAPEHLVENARRVAKAGDDPVKLKRVQKVKPPDGQVSWNEDTYNRLVNAEPEPLVSRMRVTHSMLLNVIARPGDGFEHMRHLLRENHEDRTRQNKLIRRAIRIYRELVAGGVVAKLAQPDETGRWVVPRVELQTNFALNQPLSPFALATLELLDPESETFALDVVSVLEATLEDPRPVLMAQQYAAKGEAVNAMKAEGIEYDERMELLEDITWPKPLEELLEAAYETYRGGHPWIAEFPLSPKAVVRDMVERAMTFGEFVSHYGLARSEGIVLRYLGDAYKALRQTVPDEIKTSELTDLIEWLGELIRQTDSSLLDEWEALAEGVDRATLAAAAEPREPKGVTANTRAFTVLVRNAFFRRVLLAARHRWAELGQLDGESGWAAADWASAMQPYFAEYGPISTGPDARGPHLLVVEKEPEGRKRIWTVRQIFDDPNGDHDWGFSGEVDLDASDELGAAVVRITSVGPH
ncbi:DEAD/DEAH box helicase [Sporichthya brevicatena]|uniref:DEAD/DEAH box helicase n=1 Tax=Sporichthya brevicatena TaxID=171442 RepID=A0ABN1GG14_9ACTN